MRCEKGPVAIIVPCDGENGEVLRKVYRIYGVLMSVRYRTRGFTGELYMPHGRVRACLPDGSECAIPEIPVGSAVLVGAAANCAAGEVPAGALRVTESVTRHGDTVGYTKLTLA